MKNKEIILQVKDLEVSFKTQYGILKAVRGVSFDLYKGETLAIVGESGSGKSVTSKVIMGLSAGNSIIDGGKVLYSGLDLLQLPEEQFYKIRGSKISMIFQDPMSSLNPIVRVGRQITETLRFKLGMPRNMAKKRAIELMAEVGIAEPEKDFINFLSIFWRDETKNSYCDCPSK